MATVHIDEQTVTSLLILDAASQEVVHGYPAPSADNLSQTTMLQPVWSPDERHIAFLYLDQMGKSIQLLDIVHNTYTTILPPTFQELNGPPVFYRDHILFSAGFQGKSGASDRTRSYPEDDRPGTRKANIVGAGIENIFAISIKTGALFQVTSSRFGARQPAISPDQSTLIYTDYTSDGWMIAMRPVNPDHWIPINNIREIFHGINSLSSTNRETSRTENTDKHHHADSNDTTPLIFSLAQSMAEQEGCNIQQRMIQSGNQKNNSTTSTTGTTNTTNTTSTTGTTNTKNSKHSKHSNYSKYSKLSHIFHPHSWGPLSINATSYTLKPGITVLSQNLLNTAFASTGYEYDLNEQTGKFFLDFSYQGWYPVVDLSYSYGKRAGTGRYSGTDQTFRYTWNESNLNIDIGVPLNLSRGNWFRKIQPSIGSSWIYVIHDKETPEQFTQGSIFTLDYGVFGYNYIRSNYQDVYPKFGQTISIIYRHTPFGQNDMGSIFGASGNLYFPGLFRHHGIRIYGGYQQRWDKRVYGYQFSNLVSYPRGIIQAYDEYLVSFSGNYTFPFGRIDASIGSVLYIKRFKLNLFYDGAQGWGKHGETYYQSTGFEFSTEINILRFFAPFEVGVQGAYLPDNNTWSWRFLWAVSL